MNIEVTNDFLEYLLKGMVSGMGIPPEFLSYSEQTEFARSLGMMNGKFVRAIIVKQKIFAEQFSKLLRILYKNEFLGEDEIKLKKKKEAQKILKDKQNTVSVDSKEERNELAKAEIRNKDALFDLNCIEVQFPSPQSLNMTSLSEQISNSQSVIEFIVNTLVDENDQALQKITKRKVTQDILSTFDWNKYNKIVDEAKIEAMKEALENDANKSDDDTGEDF